MQLITDSFIKSLFIRSGMESIQADIDLLEAFTTHVNGCGLESLDSPSGQLIEAGLVARYPDHFVAGSGLEGIGSLIDTLKKGLDGIKKMARGKAKPFMEKQSYGVAKEIKATYMSEAWYKNKDAIGKPVNVSGLAKLISSFTDYAGIGAAITADEKLIDDGFEKSADATAALAKRAVKDNKDLLKIKDLDDVEPAAAKLLAEWKPLVAALSSELPEIKSGSATTIDGLTVEQALAVGKLMYQLIEWAFDLEGKAEDVRIYNGGLGQDDVPEKLSDVSKSLEEVYWNCWYWESLTRANSNYADNAATWAFSVAQQLEQLIINSVK
ncbi:hypothetical protein pEaSNUABM37_00197 [Erwinia phage pEa_SNUABM_37]|nr:hypothetical protein pEaSNUABM37_00197 [Erwinia phage pEa_SNUABM_37]QXO10667.1 hypothetical protein pEaSNUABM48_00197 [Erwinia phage pEa_SNUABM_48]